VKKVIKKQVEIKYPKYDFVDGIDGWYWKTIMKFVPKKYHKALVTELRGQTCCIDPKNGKFVTYACDVVHALGKIIKGRPYLWD